MPTYPSSLYKGSTRSGNATTNDPGSYLYNNLTTYQELKDTVVGVGFSVATDAALGPNDFAGAGTSYFSAAKYPTDVRVGTTINTNPTDLIADFATAVSNLSTVLSNYSTAVISLTALEKMAAAALLGISYNNLQSKMEKVTFELNRLNNDVTLVNAGTAGGALTAVSRYPSSQNRYTRTAGGA
jgi:hypothetical protein